VISLLAEFLLLTSILAAILVIDVKSFRIPDVLSLPLLAAGLLVSRLRDLPLFDHVLGAALGFAVFAAIGSWYYRRSGIDGLGLGDAKLFAAAGAWLGWQTLPFVLLIASLGGLCFALASGMTQRKAAIAFGPWLALGMWVAWLLANAARLNS
jgi:leader peptidase (prepilin peptidase) / N-methyltransferase